VSFGAIIQHIMHNYLPSSKLVLLNNCLIGSVVVQVGDSLVVDVDVSNTLLVETVLVVFALVLVVVLVVLGGRGGVDAVGGSVPAGDVGVAVGELAMGIGRVVVGVLGVEVVGVVVGIEVGSGLGVIEVGGTIVAIDNATVLVAGGVGTIRAACSGDVLHLALEIVGILATSTGADAITARAAGTPGIGVLGEAALVHAANFFFVVGVDHDYLAGATVCVRFEGAGGVGAEAGAMLFD